jgi:small subunit ribosomal protein S17
MSEETQTVTESGRGRNQVLTGTVVSDKMDKTVVVQVVDRVIHPLYHRYMKQSSKFHAHDEENSARVGDTVEITSSRPLSKTKRWRVSGIVKRAV